MTHGLFSGRRGNSGEGDDEIFKRERKTRTGSGWEERGGWGVRGDEGTQKIYSNGREIPLGEGRKVVAK